MYLEPFSKFFPEVADKETRSVHIGEGPGIPAGEYVFVEAYCTDPACDCERVMLTVVERKGGHVATISYGFNPAKTRAWLREPNPFLDPLNPQSPYAEEILSLFQEVALDAEYDERLRRHYRMVKEAVKAGAPRAVNQGPESVLRERPPKGRPPAKAKRLRKQQKAARRRNRRR
jgi:hypothetical protein